MFAFYGRENDFRLLQDRNINMNGKVMLVRAGRISFAEKVGGFSKKYTIIVNVLLLFRSVTQYST